MSETKLEILSIPNLNKSCYPVRHILALFFFFCNKVALNLWSNCVRGFRVTKKLRLKEPGHNFEKKTVFRDNRKQSTRDKLKTLREIAHNGKSSVSIFQ